MPDHLGAANAAYRAFVRDDYDECIRIVAEVLPATVLFNLQLMVISLRRLDETRRLGLFEDEFYGPLARFPWEHALIGLTLGKVDLPAVLKAATGGEQACAVTGLVRTMSVELSPVRVNAIHTGPIEDSPYWTENPAMLDTYRKLSLTGRLGTMADVVNASIFLLESPIATASTSMPTAAAAADSNAGQSVAPNPPRPTGWTLRSWQGNR